ncbi:hypothetical protein [Hyphomicrobium sp.]|uniref:hypothetical protein n=1 Tax=Hyphomicrobium sp. TaxID=82 RepID=UPI002C9612BA|nr:hypothetical protein [Hyphomicrobium sp.]HVZ05544.1 hypothetical protein [Hyphomicrobium sp.]
MLKFLGTLARVAFGFALASIAAGFVTVLFVNTPTDVLTQPVSRLPRTADETFELAMLTATHAAIFGIVFTLIVATIGEIFSIRSIAFYLLGGILIALLGFVAQYASEVSGEPTIFNNYALKAFLTTGFFGGFVYWLAAGQFAGRAPPPAAEPFETPTETTTPSAKRNEETSVVIRKSIPVAEPKPTHRTLLNRLSFRSRPKTLTLESENNNSASSLDNALSADRESDPKG